MRRPRRSISPPGSSTGPRAAPSLRRTACLDALACSSVVKDPRIEIRLKLLEFRVDLLVERALISLLWGRVVDALSDPVRLGLIGLRSRAIDVVDRQEELVGMLAHPTTELGSPIRQDPRQPRSLAFEMKMDLVVEQIGCCARRLRRVKGRKFWSTCDLKPNAALGRSNSLSSSSFVRVGLGVTLIQTKLNPMKKQALKRTDS